MKTVKYERHEFHSDPEPREAPLPVFVYDVPYMGPCGIFPPLHIFNELLLEGGSEGGMSPGATWQPFSISRDEYRVLVETLEALDPRSLGEEARFTEVKFTRDPDFDHIQNMFEWLEAVCAKHRQSYQAKLKRT